MNKGAIFVFPAAVVAGAIASTWIQRDGEEAPQILPTRTARSAPTQPIRKSSVNWIEEAKKRGIEQESEGFNPLAAQLAGWSNDDFQRALDESLKNPESLLHGSKADELANLLLAEWMKRDFDRAFDWFSNIRLERTTRRFAETLAKHWPEDRAPEALAFLRAHRDLFRNDDGSPLIRINFEREAAAGPAALAKFLTEITSEGLIPRTFHWSERELKIPDGFDFPEFFNTDAIKNLDHPSVRKIVLAAWYKQQPEVMFDWLVAEKGTEGIAEIPSAFESGKSDFPWLGGKLEAMDPEQRSIALDALIAKDDMMFFEFPEFLSKLSLNVTDPAFLQEIRLKAVQGIYQGQTAQMIPFIESLPIEQRLEALKNAYPARPGFREFGKADEKILKLKLAEWQVGEADSAIILKNFKG